MDDRQFRSVLDRLGLSWAGYRKVRKGVKKRLRRHMRESGCGYVTAYLEAVESDEALREECERLLTVSISRFFRDRYLWQVLPERILPSMVADSEGEVRVWSAGCACGEEAYTFRIVWEEARSRLAPLPSLHLLATDMNDLCLEKARAGIYPGSSLREVPEKVRSAYFIPGEGGDRFAVRPFLREGISWERHHLLLPPPAGDFDLVFLRNNLLTYYGTERREPALQSVLESLRPGGFLVIGSHEKIPARTVGLSPIEAISCVFRKGSP